MTQDWTSFTTNIAVRSTLNTIYNAWTKSSEIEKWFLKTCVYKNENSKAIGSDINVKPEFTYEWTWYLYEVLEKGKITNANGQDFFQFTFAGNCIVDVTLKEIGESILVTLKQYNIPIDEESKFNIRIGCLQGWTFYLLNLKSFYETGYDLRNKNPELKGVNN